MSDERDIPVHIVPVDDIKPHTTDGASCPCKPTVILLDEDGDELFAPVITHNSWDGREHLEPNEDDDE